MKFLENKSVKPTVFLNRKSYAEVNTFHRKMPGYKPTKFCLNKDLAGKYGIGNIYFKVESDRFGLPAFKILGASYAVWKIIEERFGLKLSNWKDINELRNLLKEFPSLKFVSATDGNHGRGVARMGKLLGYDTIIYMPKGTVPARIEAIESEGAEVIVVDGNYDLAVQKAADKINEGYVLIQDTSWKGYEKVNNWIIEGYSTIFHEIDDDIEKNGIIPPDIVLVQIGVGSLAAAVVKHFKSKEWGREVKIVGVEPVGADCAFSAMVAGEIVKLKGNQHSVMAGLNCGTVASAAWDYLREGIDCFIAIEDDYSLRAMRELHEFGIDTSESGASGYAGLSALKDHRDASGNIDFLRLNEKSSILVVITEGITDFDTWNKVINRV